MPYRAYLDANVLVPARLRDVILTLAEVGLYRVHWSSMVLNEMVAHLPGAIRPDQVAALLAAMNRAFPEAAGEPLAGIPNEVAMTVNRKDRHVVAAALNAGADVLVTNDRGLREEVTRSAFTSALDAQSADVFLSYALDVDPLNAVLALRYLVGYRWGHADLSNRDTRDRLVVWALRTGLTATAGQIRWIWPDGGD